MGFRLDDRVLKFVVSAHARVATYTHTFQKRGRTSVPDFVKPLVWLGLALLLAQTATVRLKTESVEEWKKTNPAPRSLWRALLIKGDPTHGWEEIAVGSTRESTLFRALPLGIDSERSVYGVPSLNGGWEYLAYFETETAPIFYATFGAHPARSRMQWEPIGTSWDALLIVEERLRKLRRSASATAKPPVALARHKNRRISPDPKELVF